MIMVIIGVRYQFIFGSHTLGVGGGGRRTRALFCLTSPEICSIFKYRIRGYIREVFIWRTSHKKSLNLLDFTRTLPEFWPNFARFFTLASFFFFFFWGGGVGGFTVSPPPPPPVSYAYDYGTFSGTIHLQSWHPIMKTRHE